MPPHLSTNITKLPSSNNQTTGEHSPKTVDQHLNVDPAKVLTKTTLDNKSGILDNNSVSVRSIIDLPSVLVSEIFHCLDAKELGILSCVSTLLYKLATHHHSGWKSYYIERWGLPVTGNIPSSWPLGPCTSTGRNEDYVRSDHIANVCADNCNDNKFTGRNKGNVCNHNIDERKYYVEERTWRDLFLEREIRSRNYLGRYNVDVLYGHSEAVRSVFVLGSGKVVFSGGYDCVVRMWGLEDGVLVGTSRHLGCTIRAVYADSKLLVVGGTGGFIQCWRAVDGSRYLFDISSGGGGGESNGFRLSEHEGPVTCLGLDIGRIYSGSWDMTVRIWDRVSLKCTRVLRHSDWVLSVVPRGSSIASVAGSNVYIWDIDSGDLMNVVRDAHVGNATSLTRSHTGNLIFSGGDEGAVHMFELVNQSVLHVATWVPHSDAVQSLAFEFPWVVSASSDGRLSLIDVRKLLKSSKRSFLREFYIAKQGKSQNVEAPQRMLHGFGCNLFSVSVGFDRIVCGGEEGVIRIWNFSEALEIEQRVQALKGKRLENRMRHRKIQMGINNSIGSRVDQCSFAAKKKPVNGERTGVWHDKRGISGKLKA